MTKNIPLNNDEEAKVKSLILSRYTLTDFPRTKPDHFRAALALIDLLREATGGFGTEGVKLVPSEHVSERDTHGRLAIIFEEIYDLAQDLMGIGCGDNPGIEQDFYPRFKRDVQEKYGAHFECPAHFAASVYDA